MESTRTFVFSFLKESDPSVMSTADFISAEMKSFSITSELSEQRSVYYYTHRIKLAEENKLSHEMYRIQKSQMTANFVLPCLGSHVRHLKQRHKD